MTEVLSRVSPILGLVLFGYILQRRQFFEDTSYQRIQRMVVSIFIPCMLFTTFLNMELDASYAWLSLLFFLFMVLLLGAGFVLNAVFKFRYRFAPFLSAAFGFGTLGLPLFTLLFGVENAQYISILGVGHEFYIALVYLPLAHMYLGGTKLNGKQILRSVCNPSLIMVALGFGIRALGLNWLFTGNFLGIGVAGAIESLGNMTMAMTLVMVGYRIRFGDRENLRTSIGYASMRFGLTLGLGVLFKLLVVDHFLEPAVMFDHAWYILLFQHGALALTALVGNYCPKQDQEVINNAFILHFLGGFVLFVLYMALVV